MQIQDRVLLVTGSGLGLAPSRKQFERLPRHLDPKHKGRVDAILHHGVLAELRDLRVLKMPSQANSLQLA
jgi:hypothetical protein